MADGDGVEGSESAARLARLESLYLDLEGALRDLEDQAVAPAVGAVGDVPAPPVAPTYPDVQTWVQEWFAPMFGRRLGATHWCSRWWAHDEAVFRLEALWRSWEALRLDGAMGMATWTRDHLDPTRRELLGPDGPFQACEGDDHYPPPALPVTPPPAEWAAGSTRRTRP